MFYREKNVSDVIHLSLTCITCGLLTNLVKLKYSKYFVTDFILKWLIFKNINMLLFVARYLLSADCKDERVEWTTAINQLLVDIHGWQLGKVPSNRKEPSYANV